MSYSSDMRSSKENFESIVWPEVRKFLDGRLEAIEGSSRPQDLDIDQQSGGDYWWVEQGQGRTLMASRVQWDDGRPGFPYNTFTIRKSRLSGTKTEYQKLKDAIDNHRIYPTITIQSYISHQHGGELLSFGIAYTDKIIEYIDDELATINYTHNAEFFVVPFGAVVHHRYPNEQPSTLIRPSLLENDTRWQSNDRNTKIRYISQAHLEPGMNADKLKGLFSEYNLVKVEDWDRLNDNQIDEIIQKIRSH